MDRTNLTKAQRLEIAEWLAEDLLEDINKKCDEVRISKHTFYIKYIKRGLDIIISFIALFLTIPVNLMIGIVTFFDVGRPIFFRQVRVGKDGKEFTIVKFRNMRNLTDENGDLLHASERVTKFGKFVRKTSLDELLNFWNILKGDMSLIGPRPLVVEYMGRYNKRHMQRLAVRPGLECPPREMNNCGWSWHEQFENDIWYVENVSFVTDCKMCVRLIQFLFDRKVTASRSSVSVKGSFMGYSMDGVAINLEDVPQRYVDFYEKNESRYTKVDVSA